MLKKRKALLFVFTLVAAVGVVVCWVLDKMALSGPLLIGCFLLFALALQTSPKFKGFSFTVLIFAAVAPSLYYPQWFQRIGDFKLTGLIVPLLMLIMFGMGTAMSLQDFVGVVKMPKGVLVGIACQFTIMPLVGAGLATLFQLPAEAAAGVILVGCSSSGLASNVMAYISGANLALSLTLTAVATLLAPLMTPSLMQLLAGELVPIDFWGMLWSILKIVIFPIAAGLLFNQFAQGRFKALDRAMPSLSMVSITIVITIITAAGRDALLSIGLVLIVVVVLHNGSGYLLGYGLSRAVGLDKRSARTVAFEVGMQNAALASGIALEMGRIATMGLAPAVFGPWMNISGSSLAAWWRNRGKKR